MVVGEDPPISLGVIVLMGVGEREGGGEGAVVVVTMVIITGIAMVSYKYHTELLVYYIVLALTLLLCSMLIIILLIVCRSRSDLHSSAATSCSNYITQLSLPSLECLSTPRL